MPETDQSAIARKLASLPATNRRIAPLEIDGVRAWLKDFDQPSPAKWHHIQRALFIITRLQVLRPAPSHSGIKGVETEIAAMHRFRQIGARVPQLLWAEGARILISDIGETMRDRQHRLGTSAIGDAATTSAARELRRIHAQGVVHGRPILRNMTWDGETVGFLDFEERPTEVMPVEAAQARDVLLLLMSIARRSEAELVRTTFRAYAADISPSVEDELQRLVRASRPLAGGLGRAFARTGNRNLRGLIGALTALPGGLTSRGGSK